MKKFLTLFAALIVTGSMMVVQADTYTFNSGTTIYIDFTNVTGGADFPKANESGTQYDSNAGGTIKAVTFTTNVTWNTTSTFIKSQTGEWADLKFIVPSTGQNCAVVAADGKSFSWTTVTENDYTIYFKNTPGWSNVYIHLYSSGQTFDDDKGVGGNSAAVNAQMTKIDDGPFFKYEFSSAIEYSKVCFTKEYQNNYDNFWTNECSWSTELDFANDLVLWIPNTASSSSVNSCTYYNTGEWSVYPPVVPGVSFSGLPTSVYKGQTVTFAATSENVTNPAYTFYVKQGEEEYGSAVTEYTFNDAGTYRVKVEVRANGVGESLVDAEQVVTCTKYSLMQNNHSTSDKGSEVAVFSTSNGSVFTATWTCSSAGNYYFYASTNTSADAHENCDYLCSGQTFTDGVNCTAYLYGNASGCYDHSYYLNAPRAGEYTFTLTLGSDNYFKCAFPEALAAEVSFNAFPALMYKGITIDLTACVSSENVTNPAYTFFVTPEGGSESEIVDPVHFSPAAGSYTLKVEVREAGESGAALDTKTTTIEIKTLYLMQTDGSSKGTQVEECATTDGVHFTASWTCSSSADVYFYVTNNPASDAHSSCDYLGGGTFAKGIGMNAYLYGSSDFSGAYGAAYKLASPWDGEYEFTLTLNAVEPHSFQCDFPVEPDPVYTVAGSESAFGSDWDLNAAANEMTLDGGVYKLTKTGLELIADNIEFKVVKNHAYANGSWPASNYVLTIPSDGIYRIDITFDPTDVGNEITAVATKTGEAEIVPTVKVKGSWDWSAETTLTGDATSVSATINLTPADTYYFKMIVGGNYRSNKNWYHRDFTGAEGITMNDEDMSITVDKPGDYTFTWTFATNALSITFPDLDLVRDNLSVGKWGTLCPKQTVENVRGATFYQISYLEEQGGLPYNMVFDEISGTTLTAGQPYFFIATAEKIEGAKTGDAVSSGSSENGFHGYIGATSWELPYVADYNPAVDNTFVIYNNSVFRINQAGTMLQSERCYILINATVPSRAAAAPMPGRRRISMGVQNTDAATGIEDVQGDNVQCTKVLINGQLFILRGEHMFDATGRLVK